MRKEPIFMGKETQICIEKYRIDYKDKTEYV